ncbi:MULTISPECIES: extracellular solute-binding protein [unclassified Paenibacillus]|uniref:extracellular solute-binding protein n=1 Tax=unclassified Paenibacillus TaxID=185978 RepID=UPI000899F05C|nr:MULTISPECIES: extracellular solute-binding protein [unclassified Paenibacillus]OMC70663.1 ABC transporter substrate-binding protein [Paenibacillus sp. FSL H7-0326]SDW04019.1 ABC-type glycerol-3-phosphate transport system, substrate-binding protein [Paenibacillus sp. PDC88]
MRSRKNKGLIVVLVLALALSIWTLYPSQDRRPGTLHALEDFEAVSGSEDEHSYEHYLTTHANTARPDEMVRIEGESYAQSDGGEFEVVQGYAGLEGSAVITPERGTLRWDVPVQVSGLYHIRIHYYPVEGKSSGIERRLEINGEIPFRGADALLFDRVWGNREENIRQDDRGNDLKPRQVEQPEWQLASFKDSAGYFEEPYQFYFEKGSQQLSLTSLRENMAIDYIELYQEGDVPSYEELKKTYDSLGLKKSSPSLLKVQGEDAVSKSSPTLAPISDRSSPSLEPYHVSKIRMNAIGGMNWKLPGEWIEWEIDVPEDGLYQMAFKVKQDQLRGIYATRSLTINGKVPFKEMKRIRFNYSPTWQTHALGIEEDEPYQFHLEKGKHRIRLTVTLGDIAPLLRTVESSVLELNEMYRKILMITSNQPDPLRDYQLEQRIPEMTEVFERQADTLRSVADYLEQSTGEQSDKVAVLNAMVVQLEDMAARPETVPKRLDTFKINVGGLGTWILMVREQPIAIDYLVVSPPDEELPEAEATAIQQVKHELGAYIASYTEDYDSIGNVERKKDSITVWITTGRDQAQVLKGMIDDSFTPDTDISVQLRLVPPNILLPATLAGEGPDVAMQMGEDIPVNYAMRNAAADLSRFPDFEEISGRFRESGLTPYRYNEGVYALPEQQQFPMLFYRKDILNELGLEPPQTWEEVYNTISVLQKHNMEFYLPIDDTLNNANLVPNATFAMLLYQNDGTFYTEDEKKSALDSEISMDAFKRWTQFYTNYKFPLKADFPNRFRTGEMPIGIADYTTYNMLTVMAPEIRNLWDFTIVPGTQLPDGSIRHEVASSTSAVMMLENAANKEAAWKFMKWWTDEETQIEYGREMEGLMGAAARYPTANIKALEQLPWPVKDYQNLEKQWEWVKGIPQLPGGYFTGRHLDNAFRKVVNASENPREALSDYVLYIDEEIELKRKEFNLK